jgi:FAD/FMN-containing dehydrogenase
MTNTTLASIAASIAELLAQQLARPWEFQGESGFRLTPQSADQVAYVLNWAQTSQCRLAVDYLEACRLPTPVWLDLSALNHVRQYPVEDFIIEVETGLTFGELDQLLANNRQALPLSYPAEATIAEILAEDRPALETGLRGSFRDYVLKTEIATPDGQVTISGADVVKNATGYDLAKLYVGGRHAFGVVTSVTLKLIARPQAKRYWWFPASSLQSACMLSEKLLTSQLPLSVCEIYQSDSGWQIFAEFSGDDWLMVDTQDTLLGTDLATSSQIAKSWEDSANSKPPQRLDEAQGLALRAELERWPVEATRLEVALPLSKWAAFAVLVSKQSTLNQLRLQVRPAAGLVHLSAPMFPSAALKYLQTEALAQEGFAQLLQIAPTDAAILSEAEAIMASFNLPTDPSVRRLLNDLKKSYDPQGILHTPSLPL